MVNEGVAQKVGEFDTRHSKGNNPVVRTPGWFLFEDGAQREINQYGSLREPPEDLFERQKLIVMYWEYRTMLAVQKFQLYKSGLLNRSKIEMQSKRCPPPPDKSALQQLEELKQEAENLNSRFKEEDEKLKVLTPKDLINRQKQYEENRQAYQDFVQQIPNIEI